jgi:hypothetical protein
MVTDLGTGVGTTVCPPLAKMVESSRNSARRDSLVIQKPLSG